MDTLFGVDWRALFSIDTPVLEIVLRGTLVYLGLFFLLRLVLKRETGTVGISDLLVVVLLADASQNALAGSYDSVPEGFILVSTIIFWAYFLDWLGYRFPRLQRLVHPPPLLLVKDGEMLHRNMRKELITRDELMSMLRQRGVDDLSEVKEVYMEGDGRISVLLRDRQGVDSPDNEAPPRG